MFALRIGTVKNSKNFLRLTGWRALRALVLCPVLLPCSLPLSSPHAVVKTVTWPSLKSSIFVESYFSLLDFFAVALCSGAMPGVLLLGICLAGFTAGFMVGASNSPVIGATLPTLVTAVVGAVAHSALAQRNLKGG